MLWLADPDRRHGPRRPVGRAGRARRARRLVGVRRCYLGARHALAGGPRAVAGAHHGRHDGRAIATVLTAVRAPTLGAAVRLSPPPAAGLRLPPRRRRRPRSSVCTVAVRSDVSLLAGADGGTIDLDRGAPRSGIGVLFVALGGVIRANSELRDAARRAGRAGGGRGAPALRARPARPARPEPVGDRAQGRAGRAAAAGPPEEAPPPHRRAAGRVARRAGRGPRGGGRLPPPDARRRAGGRADGARGGRASRPSSSSRQVTLPADVEAVLAWTVREGATNVIRHSGARHATIRIEPGPGGRERRDRSTTGAARTAGRRRAGTASSACASACRRLGGELDAGPAPDGGFRLRVSVPARRPASDPRPARGGPDDGARGAGEPARARGRTSRSSPRSAAATRCSPRRAPRGPTWRCSTSRCRAPRGSTPPPALRAELPDTRVLILTTFGRPGYLRRAMEQRRVGLPAQGRAGRPSSRRRSGGQARASAIVDPGLAAAALSEGDSPLTAREREVLDAARRHGTVAELAAALHLSPGTTRNHLSAIMEQARRAATGSRRSAIAEEKGWL